MYKRLKTVADNLPRLLRSLRPRPVVVHDLKVIYYPIPKAATSSVLGYFLETVFLDGARSADDMTPNQIHGFDFPRTSLSEAVRLGRGGYISFAVVREPYSRLESCYRDKILDSRAREEPLRYGFARYNRLLGKDAFSTGMSFCEFVNAVERIPDLLADEHFRSQWRFLPCGRRGLKLDHLIRIERFDEDMGEMCARNRLPEWKNKRFNKRNDLSADDRSEVGGDPDLRRRVHNRYKQDFELLGYRS